MGGPLPVRLANIHMARSKNDVVTPFIFFIYKIC